MANLTHTSIEIPTVRGQIKGTYEKSGNRIQIYNIELPANMVGEFVGDFSAEDVVSLNGKTVNLTFGTIRLGPGRNNIEIRINSF
jgi:alpha-L-rhamnosidase